MNIKKVLEYENRQLRKFRPLPHPFKKAGWILMALSLVAWLGLGIFGIEEPYLGTIVKDILLVGMLLVTISKERIEDEYIQQLRLVAFGIAFVAGVFHAVFQPMVNYLIQDILEAGPIAFKEFDSFIVLWFMLIVQIGIFHVLKFTR